MSKYTTKIRHILENGYDLGLQYYPIFDEKYRDTLNEKILENYYFREIGLEPVGLFKRKLNHKMNMIMPYYNQLYKSELIKIEPLTRLDWSEKYDWDKEQDTNRKTEVTDNILNEGEEDNVTDTNIDTLSDTTQSSNSSSSSNSKNKSMENDTPNKLLNWDDLEGGMFASKVGIGEGVDSSTDTTEGVGQSVGSDTSNTIGNVKNTSKSDRESLTGDDFSLVDTEKYLKHIFGNNAMRTDSEMLIGFRETFLNIDFMIIEELEELFMQIW